MAQLQKHKISIEALVDVTEAMLNVMETKGIDPETVTKRPEFSIFIHFLWSFVFDLYLSVVLLCVERLRLLLWLGEMGRP